MLVRIIGRALKVVSRILNLPLFSSSFRNSDDGPTPTTSSVTLSTNVSDSMNLAD